MRNTWRTYLYVFPVTVGHPTGRHWATPAQDDDYTSAYLDQVAADNV